MWIIKGRDWTPAALPNLTLWLEPADLNTVTFNGQTASISQWADKSGNNYHAVQTDAALQPTLAYGPPRVVFSATEKLVSALPATTGTLVFGTYDGTGAYGVNISSGGYDIGRRNGLYMPQGVAFGYILTSTPMSSADQTRAIEYMQTAGGGGTYQTVTDIASFWRDWTELTSVPQFDFQSATNFSSAWRGCTGLTSFPNVGCSATTSVNAAWRDCSSLASFSALQLTVCANFSFAWYGCSSLTSFPSGIDTAAGTNFNSAWRGCSALTSFPLLNLANGTNFTAAWRDCTSLTTVPANLFNGSSAVNFTNAFFNTALTQQSIDNILVSIESNNTSNGTFNQTGGSSPSTTGEAAITNLRGRGWTVTVTGGF